MYPKRGITLNIRDNKGESASEKLPVGSFFIKHFVAQQEVSEFNEELHSGISIKLNNIITYEKDNVFFVYK